MSAHHLLKVIRIIKLTICPFHATSISYTSALVSVRKNEESLRKLRKSRKSTFSLFGGGGSAGAGSTAEEQRDELNIQAQMVLDIEALRKDAQELGVNVDASKAFKELQAVAKGQDAGESSDGRTSRDYGSRPDQRPMYLLRQQVSA